MQLCSEGHGEVCFETGYCPCCELIEETEKLEDEIADLKQQIKDQKEGTL